MPSSTPFAESAVELTQQGFKVFPLKPKTKDPLAGSGGSHDATDNLEIVRGWANAYASSNIGYRTGKNPDGSGLFVVDTDGPEAEKAFEKLAEANGGLPATATVRSGRGDGGRHYLFNIPDGQPVKGGTGVLGDHIDIRGEGNYTVAPPSVHPDTDNAYVWENGADIADAPEWLLEMVRAGKNRNGSQKSIPHADGGVANGGRNDALISQGGFLRGKGYTEQEIYGYLQDFNARNCNPPLDTEEVAAVAHSAARYPDGFSLSDVGNAERLVARHGHNIRYCFAWKSWMIWTGARWTPDTSGEIQRMAKDTVKHIYTEAADAEDQERRKSISKHARASEAGTRIKAMIELAQSEPGVALDPADLDTDPYALNVNNGTVDLRTGQLHQHRRADLITKLVPVNYEPEADAPQFDAFMDTIMGGDPGLIRFVYQALGYGLTGDTSERALFICWGSGRNGKSTLMERMHHLAGDYGMRMPTDTLMAAHKNSVPNDIARLAGQRFVSAQESEKGKALAESTVKEMTGNDTMTGRFLHKEFFDFQPSHKVFLSTNYQPQISADDQAIWDRVKLIPFNVRIPDFQVDPHLHKKLDAELPGILARVVRGAMDWAVNGLQEPDAVRNATAEYREDMDPLAEFLEDRCVTGDGYKVPSATLAQIYQGWAHDNDPEGMTYADFHQAVKARFGKTANRRFNGQQVRCYTGVGLKADYLEGVDTLEIPDIEQMAS